MARDEKIRAAIVRGRRSSQMQFVVLRYRVVFA